MEPPQIRDVIAGKYRLEAVLGEGGFGIVYRARRIETDRIVAVKVLKQPRSSATHRARFRRELRAVAAFDSPYIPILYDYGETDGGLPYMVTEYIDGQDLNALLERRQRLEEHEARHILAQLLGALETAHAAGVVHRDIKPGNVRVFSHDGDPLRVKLLDFGIARDLNETGPKITGTGVVIGTPRYMAPEALVGEDPHPASDIFSLGLVAREMVLGPANAPSRPFEVSFDNLLLGDDAPVSAHLRSVINRMLAATVEERFATARQALDALLGSQSIAASLPSTEVPTRRLQHVEISEAAETLESASDAGSLESYSGAVSQESGSTTARRMWLFGVIGAVGLLAGIAGLAMVAEHPGTEDDFSWPPVPPPAPPPVVETDQARAGRSTEPAEEPRPAVPPGLHERELNGMPWLLFVPPELQPRPPIVVLLHANDADAQKFVEGSGFAELATAKRFVVVAPEDRVSLANPWEDPASANRVYDIAKHARQMFCGRDDCPTYLVGDAAGAHLALGLSCEAWVSGVAIAGTRDWSLPDNCPSQPPVIWLASLNSPRLPWEGGVPCPESPTGAFMSAKPSHAEALNDALRRLGCEGEPTETFTHATGSCEAWTCARAFEVCAMKGGDAWPGMPATPANCSSAGGDFPAAARVWDFFSDRRAPKSP